MNNSSLNTREPLGGISEIYRHASIFIVVLLFWLALQLYVPTLSIYVQERTHNLSLTGIVLSMSGLMGFIIRLPLGMVTDWIGRCKPAIIAGMIMAAVGAYMMAATNSVYGLAIGRALTGLAAGTWVPILVLYSNLFPPSKIARSAAILTVIISFSRMLATSLTGWLNEAGGYALAFYLSVLIAGLAILFLAPLKESSHYPVRPDLKVLKTLSRRRDVAVPSLLNIIGQYVGVTAVYSFGPILAKQLGAGNITLSALATWNFIFYILGNFSATLVTGHNSQRNSLLASFILMSAGLGFLAFAPTVVWIFVAHACYGVAGGYSYPVFMGMSIQNVSENERSTAMGLHQSIYAIGTFAGPWLSGILANSWGIQPMFGFTAIACLVLSLLGTQWLYCRRDKRDASG